jgi:putative endonuclease
MADTKILGTTGEDTACNFLKKNGYKIIERSWQCRQGEIDIIAKKGKLLAFVEVKARSKEGFGGPAAAVTKSKQKKITASALNYIKLKKPKFKEISFDVIAIVDEGKIEHIKNAFAPRRFAY